MILPTVAKRSTGNQPSCKRRNSTRAVGNTHIQHKHIKEREKKNKSQNK